MAPDVQVPDLGPASEEPPGDSEGDTRTNDWCMGADCTSHGESADDDGAPGTCEGGPCPTHELIPDDALSQAPLEPDGAAATTPDVSTPNLCDAEGACSDMELQPYIVRLKPADESAIYGGIDSEAVRDAPLLASRYGGQLLFTYKMARAFAGQFTPQGASELASDPNVLHVEWADAPITFDSFATAKAVTRWNGLQANALGVVNPAMLPYRGKGVGVAMIDTGVDATHVDLQYDTWATRGPSTPVYENYEVVSLVAAATPNSDAAGGHGTHVAGVMMGQDVGAVMGKGLAPGAGLYAIGAGEQTTLLWVTQAYDFLLARMSDGSWPIRVVQNSWGSGTTYDPFALLSWQIEQAVARNAVVVFSAGNGGGDGAVNQVNAQCQVPVEGVVCVGGFEDNDKTDRDMGSIYFASSRGSKSDPGTWPDLVAPATRIVSAKPAVSNLGAVTDISYTKMTGTSVAAPIVSATVALMLEANPTLTPARVEACLEATSYRFADGGAYAVHSDLRFNGSHFAKGHGLVNIEAAVLAAKAKVC